MEQLEQLKAGAQQRSTALLLHSVITPLPNVNAGFFVLGQQ